MTPQEPATTAELAEVLAACGAQRQTVELGGHFSKRSMGGAVAPAAAVVSTARLSRVAEYEPKDLTISVEAGLGFAALQELLAEHRQMLPLDPPCPERATVGGVMAANCAGPRRRLYGSARDMVIGMTFVNLEGQEVKSGGMVVKNVAGLDMAKLLIGSFGTLAAIARVNFKVVPRPPQERTWALGFEALEAALKARDQVLRSVLQPAAIDLVNPEAGPRIESLPGGWVLLVEAGGIEAVMARYDRELKGVAHQAAARDFAPLEEDAAREAWRRVRDFPAAGDEAVVRLSMTLARLGEGFQVAGQVPALARAGNGILYARTPDPAGLARRARAAGLYAVIESWAAPEKSQAELWADPGPELEVMSRIKAALDPQRLLDHGRLYNRL
jgi:glycolate oxidase FAD binding subunit